MYALIYDTVSFVMVQVKTIKTGLISWHHFAVKLPLVVMINPPSTHVGVCRNLKSIVVQIGIEDYFEDPNSPEARKLFDEMVNKLQVTAPVCHSSNPALSVDGPYSTIHWGKTKAISTYGKYFHPLLMQVERNLLELMTCASVPRSGWTLSFQMSRYPDLM